MPQNTNISFNLSKGNPFKNVVGMHTDRIIYGHSIGGQIFLEQLMLTGVTIPHSLKNETYDVFDPIVLSDLVKNLVNYRCVYIVNNGTDYIVLDTINSLLSKSAYLDFNICDIKLATEGYFTIPELQRYIPTKSGTAGNPSIYIDDEYDSTGKLSNLEFKSELTADDLPAEIPPNCALKLWIKREVAISKVQIPDGEFDENVTIYVKEFNSDNETSLSINYTKKDGRIPLSNWYEYTITPGSGKPIVMRELIPKEVDLSVMHLIKTFIHNEKVVIFYYTEVGVTLNYHILIVEPHDSVKNNKYIHILLGKYDTTVENFNCNLCAPIVYNNAESKKYLDIFKSHYDSSVYYMFWQATGLTPNAQSMWFGQDKYFQYVGVDTVEINLWTDSATFNMVSSGYEFRRILNYEPIKINTIREYASIVNIDQFDDLFIVFAKDTKNSKLINLQDVKLNRNELLYVFEKDIISSEKTNNIVVSQRLYPDSAETVKYITAFNNAKNSSISTIFSNPENISTNIDANRKIKYLLDGNRYVDMNSMHFKEFNIGKGFVTHELPVNADKITDIFSTFGISIDNDTNIYDSKKSFFATTNILNNVINGITYEKPAFQKNIIDSLKTSLSIPQEWADRTYKDEWVDIIGTLPVDGVSVISVKYNFYRNLWKAEWHDSNGIVYDKIINKLSGQQSTSTTTSSSATSGSPTSGNPVNGKEYSEVNITDLQNIIEPDTYQPFSVKISVQNISGNKYSVRFRMWFKGNTTPIIDIQTTTYDITSLGYVCINPQKQVSLRINYFDIVNSVNYPETYVISTIHKSILNNLTAVISDEKPVNAYLNIGQSDFKYYRNITFTNLPIVDSVYETYTTVPIILYGNSYKKDDETNNLAIEYPFDFKTVKINDKSLRFYFDNDFTAPVPFKIETYNYANDYAIVWVRISNWSGNNKKLFMFYGKINSQESILELRKQYLTLKSNIYNNKTLGAWSFSNVYYDQRLSYSDGKIFNIGEPVIYEKSGKHIHLSRIDKEYMYGVAKIYKSNKFNLEIDIPAEESLFFDQGKKEQFINFIRDTATLLKPSYTEINDIRQYGYDILESGESAMTETTNKRVAGLVAVTPNANVHAFYDRRTDNKFNLLTSFNGYGSKIDWVAAKPINTPIFKSGVLKVNGKLKSEVVRFETPFKDSNYYIFLSVPSNNNIYWEMVCNNRFTITSSYYLMKEISWMAFHKDIFGGVYTPDSIFVGKRTVVGYEETTGGESPIVANLSNWYNSELLIKPEIGVDGDPGSMVFPAIAGSDPVDYGYSVLLSSNQNINMYWKKKSSNQFSVKSSSPVDCTIHWLALKNGVEWWKEIN